MDREARIDRDDWMNLDWMNDATEPDRAVGTVLPIDPFPEWETWIAA